MQKQSVQILDEFVEYGDLKTGCKKRKDDYFIAILYQDFNKKYRQDGILCVNYGLIDKVNSNSAKYDKLYDFKGFEVVLEQKQSSELKLDFKFKERQYSDVNRNKIPSFNEPLIWCVCYNEKLEIIPEFLNIDSTVVKKLKDRGVKFVQ